MIKVLENDALCQFVLEGQHEVIITQELFGAKWKAKLDVYDPKARIVDLKTTRGIHHKVWDAFNGGYVSWAEAYGYIGQLSVYAELERRWTGRENWLEPLIVAVSKEDPPDKAVIAIDEGRMELELEQVESELPRVLAVKNGQEKPFSCGECRYCRETKQLSSIIHFSELIS